MGTPAQGSLDSGEAAAAAEAGPRAEITSGRSATCSRSPSQSRTARSITLTSSRTLPGQGYRRIESSASSLTA